MRDSLSPERSCVSFTDESVAIFCLRESVEPSRGRDSGAVAWVRAKLLVRVRAASLNPSDVRISAYFLPPLCPARRAAILPASSSQAILPESARRSGRAGSIGSTRDGSHAEFILLPAQGARPKPRHLSMIEAASSGINYITAYAGVVGKVAIRAGETLLVTGASGGVGSSVVKIARFLGAKIIGVDRKADPSKGLDLLARQRNR